MPANTSVEGRSVFPFFLYTSGRDYENTLDHYLAWVQIREPQTAFFLIGSRDAGVCFIAGLILFALHFVQITDISIGKALPLNHNKTSSMLSSWCDTGAWTSSTNSLLLREKTFFLTPSFRTWEQYCHIGKLYRFFTAHLILTNFFTALVQFFLVIFRTFSRLSHKLLMLMLMKLSSAKVNSSK